MGDRLDGERAVVLFIDDDATGREVAAYQLRQAGFRVDLAEDGQVGLKRFDPTRHAVVITDLKMPRIGGMEVLQRVREQAPEVPVLVITAFGSLEVGVDAMRSGAYDVLAKPFQGDQLRLSVARAAERSRLARENRRLRRQLSGVERPIVHASQGMANLLQTVDRLARSSATVLITGESGTGKELVARRLHARSDRSEGPFVAINCAAVPAELLESELFGHVKGAFTGADKARKGRFRQADTGTLFLDEVGALSSDLQSKLLRVLQERVVDVVGSDESVQVDIRLVAATNRDLRAGAAVGEFREDLYYRLAVVEVELPPLRDRIEDIEALARHFVAQAGQGRALAVPAAVVLALKQRSWPGNVRELENACERMAVLATGDEVRPEDLPPVHGRRPATSDSWLDHLPAGISLIDLEKQAIEHALRRSGGNVSAAARTLGVPRHILVYRIEKYGIRVDG